MKVLWTTSKMLWYHSMYLSPQSIENTPCNATARLIVMWQRYYHHGSVLGAFPNTKKSSDRFVRTAIFKSKSKPKTIIMGKRTHITGLSFMFSKNPRVLAGKSSCFFFIRRQAISTENVSVAGIDSSTRRRTGDDDTAVFVEMEDGTKPIPSDEHSNRITKNKKVRIMMIGPFY